jgi:MFS family permease
MKNKKLLTPVILTVSFVSLFTDIASEMLYPVMPVYLQSIGFSVVLIGILEGMAEATAGLSKGYFGHLSDRHGKRVPFIQWGYGLSAFSKPMMAAFSFPLWIFIARTIDRLGKGVRTSARDAMLSDESTPETKGKVFGFHRALDTTGAAIGPFLALAFLAAWPGKYQWLFILALIPGLIAVFLTSMLKDKNVRQKKPEKYSGRFFSYLKYWKTAPPKYKHLVAGLMIFTFFNSSDAFLLLNAREQLHSDTQMIGFYIFYNMVYALAAFPLGMLADKIGLKTILIIGLVIFAIVYLFMGLATNYIHFALLFFMYALYAAATEGVSKALISNIADKSEVATAIGFYTSFASIFALFASTFAGFLWYTFSAKAMFIVSATGVLCAVFYLVFSSLNNKNGNPVLGQEL